MLALVVVFASGLLALLAYAMLRPDEPGDPEGRIAFSAGGSIYVVEADGSNLTRVVEGERIAGLWASAPAFSPDGSRIAFARDFDVWILDVAHDTFEHLDVAHYEPSPGASNWSVGVTNVSWSPDGEQLLFGTARIGGSGLGYIERIRADGRDRARLFSWSAGLILPWWLSDGHVAFAGNGDQIALLDPHVQDADQTDLFQNPDGKTFSRIEVEDVGWPGVIDAHGSKWLVGSFFEEAPITYGEADGMRQVASGVSPELSPDGGWIAYFREDTIRLVRGEGSDDHLLVDLEPLGGRDRHFASQPECYPEDDPACSYRPPILSWTAD